MWIAAILLLVIILTGCVLIIGTDNKVTTHDETDTGLILTETNKEEKAK